MSYHRPETGGYEPRDRPRPADEPAWGTPNPLEPQRPSPGRRAGRRSGRGKSAARLEPQPEPAGYGETSEQPGYPGRVETGEPAAEPGPEAEDHTMPPPSPLWLHRLPPIAITIVISAGLILGTQLERTVYAIGIGVLQLAMIGCITWLRRVDGAWVVLTVGVLLALAADWAAVDWTPVSILPMAVLLALAFQAGAAGQLLRRDHTGVTESLGFTAIVCLGAVGYTSYIALSRLGSAPPAMYSAVIAAGTAIVAARAVDLVMPDPRINRQVTRGAFGIVIGTMCGTAAAAYAGMVIEGPEPGPSAIGGLLVSLTAVLVDLATGYISAARRIDGEGTAPWPVIGAAGPLLAFAIAGPVVYLLSAYYIID